MNSVVRSLSAVIIVLIFASTAAAQPKLASLKSEAEKELYERLKSNPQWKLSDEDAIASAWLARPITGTWKKTPLETVLRELSKQEQIDVRPGDTLPELDRQEPVTFTAKELPLDSICDQVLRPRGMVLRAEKGRLVARLWPTQPQPPDPKIAASLRELSTFEFIDVPLKKVLQKFAGRHHVKIVLELSKESKVTPDVPITFSSDDDQGRPVDTTLRGALLRLLEPLQLTFEIRDGAIRIVDAPELE